HTEQTLKEEFQHTRFETAAQRVSTRNKFGLPQRLWEFLVEQAGIPKEMRWADLPAKEQNKLAKNCCAFEFQVKGKTTFKEEFVTAGGIHLSEIDPNTMMSRKCTNLYFAGEIMDVDGITGGFNFQHAWSSAFVAAKAISECAN
ncbi:MAG TPA: NAD(P)/FAD-dependent oxidoreductase, partial [Chitinophagaceae bacterium]|nr:NAD(P)/FAD-dependent oxidoreductase [Chitinophagaceae bacterium]